MIVERPNYFTGQFLKEADLLLEQEYHKNLLRLHNRHLHTSGIADGMMVTHQANTLDITISGGTAIDRQGRTIVLGLEGHTLSFAGKTEGTWYVAVFYSEAPTAETEETGVKGFTRVQEAAQFEILNGPPSTDSNKLALAEVILENTGAVAIKSVDNSVRDLSGVASGESLVVSRNPAAMAGNQALRVDGDAYITGKVGIGTATPAAMLDVKGQINYENLSKLDVADNFTAAVRCADFLIGHSSRKGTPGRALVDGGGSLYLNFAGDWTNTILGGNVGIGTSSPGMKLEVAGPVTTGPLTITPQNNQGEGGELRLVGAGSNPSWYLDAHWNRMRVFGGADGGEKFAVMADGNVGIGTATPGAKLHIANTSVANWTYSTLANNISLELGQNSGGNVGSIKLHSYAANHFVFLRPSNGNFHLDCTTGEYYLNWDESVRGASNGTIHFANEAGTETVRLATAGNSWFTGGNVGIGTTGPGATLDVNGTMKVSGAIISPEGTIRDDNGGWVRTYGQTGWYSQTYGGGWYMIDTSWIRSYGNKNIYQNTGILRTDGTLEVGSAGGTLSVANGGNFAYRTNVLFANTAGNVGIGTNAPGVKLDVRGTLRTSLIKFLGEGGNSNQAHNHYGIYQAPGAWAHPYPDLVINFHTGIQYVGYFNYGGHRFYTGYTADGTPTTEAFSVGNGDHATRVNYDLHVSGRIHGSLDHLRSANNAYTLNMQNDRNLVMYQGVAPVWWTSTNVSDKRLKKNIQSIRSPLQKLSLLSGVHFDWKKSANMGGGSQIGVIAQEVESVFPELISNIKGRKLVNYQGLAPVLIEAVKEQQKQIEVIAIQGKKNQEESAAMMRQQKGADFAEYFKSVDGNSIEPGVSVALDKGKVRPAKKGETPLGVTSTNPRILGGIHAEWPKKYLKDPFGNDIMEEYKEEIMIHKTEKIKRERQKVVQKTIEQEVSETVEKKVKGKMVMVEVKKTEKREIDEPQFNEVEILDEKTKEVVRTDQVPVMETYEVEEPVFDEVGQPVMIGSGKFETKTRPKLNPDFDPNKEYVPREQRPEWNVVGLLGQIPLRKGQPTAPGWVKLKDIGDDVELWLVK